MAFCYQSFCLLNIDRRTQLYALDFQDASKWLNPKEYKGRLKTFKVEDNTFSSIDDDSIDFFWSFGVLCHNNIDYIKIILKNALPKVKVGGYAVHQYSDWEKLEHFGWDRGKIPIEFKNKTDDEIWWPRNS